MIFFIYSTKKIMKQVNIRPYNKEMDESNVMGIILNEEGWDYANEEMREKYALALEKSITFVAYSENELCGYCRSLNDFGMYIWVCDLLVAQLHRGQNIGRQLMECLYDRFPDSVVYVMSGADKFYEKIGYSRKGSVFLVPRVVQKNT